jgi:hypothetical protein
MLIYVDLVTMISTFDITMIKRQDKNETNLNYYSICKLTNDQKESYHFSGQLYLSIIVLFAIGPLLLVYYLSITSIEHI